MTRSRRHNDMHGNNNEVSQEDCMEGTSARTRPLSFNDIMLRRKTKGDAPKQVPDGPGGAHIVLARDHVEKRVHSPEYNGQLSEDFVHTDTKHASNDPQKLSSWNKGDTDASSKLVQDKDMVFRDPEFKLKSIVNKNISSDRAVGGKNEKHYPRNRNKDCLSTYDSNNVSDKQQVKDSVKKELVPERSREKSKLNRKLLDNEDRQVYRKRKPDKRVISDAENESKKIKAREMTQRDNFLDRSRDKSKKESKHKHHHEEEDKARSRSAGKKHDSETKGVNLTGGFLEESRLKSRHSHSRERGKDKGRRSPSRSPKAQKHKSKNKRQHEEQPEHSHSTKDRPGKEHSDVEKKRISSNGSSSHYKRNTGSSSGLGGYSPRKRKTEAAAKTPSPTRRSPEKKLAGWDLLPAGKESITAGLVLSLNTSDQNLPSNVKEFPSVTPVTPTVVKKPVGISHLTLSSQMHAVESVQLTQATRPMRRLYVENLPASASEKDLMECINNFFLSSAVNYIHGTRPCISCIIHREKGQALLEFLTPEDASAALSFNGIPFFGFDLKLRRPKDYNEVTTGLPDKSLPVADSISNIVEDSPHKIFIGGLSKFITSEMLLEIARVFGPVKAYHFEFITNMNGPCAFLEYVDHSITSKACAGLNGMRLGGQVVTAVVATADPFLEEKVGKLPFYGIPENAKPLLEKPTAVLKLQNVLDPEGLLSLSESELEEIMEDIKLECSRFGTVKSINIVKPTNSNGTTDEFEEKNADASTDGCGLEFDDKSYRTEQFGERVNEFGEDRLEPLEMLNDFVNNNNKTVEDNKGCVESVDPEVVNRSTVIGDSLSDEIIAEKLMEDEMCEPRLVNKNISGEDPSFQGNFSGFTVELNHQQNASNIEFKSSNKNADSIPVPNIDRPLTEEESKLEEGDAKIRSAVKLEGDEMKELNSPVEGGRKDSSTDHGDVFKPGNVFVEYKRAEATCMAAHCLQGRLFDGRVLTVGYVDHGLYQTRFHR